MTFLGGLLAVLLSGCGTIPKTIDTTDGQLKLDSEVALIKTDLRQSPIFFHLLTRLSDGTVVYNGYEEQYPRSMFLTFRLWPGKYQIEARNCLTRQRLMMGTVNFGCARIFGSFELEAGHMYLVGGSQIKEGWWYWQRLTLTAWVKDTTSDSILYESQIGDLRPY